MLDNTSTTAKNFRNDDRGAVALIFALTCTFMLLITGLAVDMGRTYHANSKISGAIDGAALAGARGMRLYNLNDSEIRALARKYFDSNIAGSGGNYATISQFNVVIDRTNSTVKVDVEATVPMTFGQLGSTKEMVFPATSTAKFESDELEVSLQLDLTGSMTGSAGSGGTKIDSLKTATKEFIDILMPDVMTGQKVRIGLAPFSAGVNAGDYLKAVDNNRAAADGCTYERTSTTNQTTDAVPTSTDALKIKTDLAGAQPCPTAKVIAMSDDKNMLKAEVATYRAAGTTAGHLGTAWAYYLLSPKWSAVWPSSSQPAPYKKDGVQKIAVLMTDGEYNTVAGQSNDAAGSSKFAVDTCKAMKEDGIIVYTIGFRLTDSRAVKTLADCASPASGGKSRALLAEDGTQLQSTFRAIAEDITTLRLSH